MTMINYDGFWDVPYSERSLAIACTRGRQAVVAQFSPLLADAGVSEQQWRVMRVLEDFNLISLSDLSDKSCIHKVSVTRILRILASRGYVEVTRDKKDKRAFNVRITSEGAVFNQKYAAEASRISQKIVQEFGIEKSLLLLVLLDDLSKLSIVE